METNYYFAVDLGATSGRTIVGHIADEQIQLEELTRFPTPLIETGGHDTASAVAAVPAKDENFAYLSSGTWSLMGIETKDAIINDLSYERN